MPDRGGQSQDALGDAGTDPGDGLPAVAFEIELSLEGGVDRFDDLAQWFEEPLSGPWFLALACRSQELDVGAVDAGLELSPVVVPVVVLVPDRDLAVLAGRGQRGGGGQDLFEHFAFVGLGAAQGPADRVAVQGADKVQAKTPEEAGVRGPYPRILDTGCDYAAGCSVVA